MYMYLYYCSVHAYLNTYNLYMYVLIFPWRQVFSDALEGKKETVREITVMAEELKEEDGPKSNGTSDVDSR